MESLLPKEDRRSQYEEEDEFFHHTSHIDPSLVTKIEKGEYIELVKLLPCKKIIHSDGRLQMIYKDGCQFLQPISEKDAPPINSLHRWEQAFEIYSTIYTAKNPSRAQELFRYMFNIRSVASTYVWDNVYAYDVTFRKLMERGPQYNWGLNYHQGWDLYLKEKLDKSNSPFHISTHKKKGNGKCDHICWRFNRRKCSYGPSCRFEHKCLNCTKGDHGSSSCPTKKDRSTGWVAASASASGH